MKTFSAKPTDIERNWYVIDAKDKIYTRFSGYVGGKKVETPRMIRKRRPVLLVENAVWGMIPKNRLGRAQYGKLKVYAGDQHPHEAQQPKAFEIA